MGRGMTAVGEVPRDSLTEVTFLRGETCGKQRVSQVLGRTHERRARGVSARWPGAAWRRERGPMLGKVVQRVSTGRPGLP